MSITIFEIGKTFDVLRPLLGLLSNREREREKKKKNDEFVTGQIEILKLVLVAA